MKLTRKHLIKLIQEAIYLPAGITKDDIDYFIKSVDEVKEILK